MSFTQPEAEACIVCGAPEGSCGDHEATQVQLQDLSFREWAKDYRPPVVEERDDDIITQDRVFETLPIPRSKRTRTVVRYGRLRRISAEEAARLNVGPDGLQTAVPVATWDNTGSIPLNAPETSPPEVQGDPMDLERPAGPPIEYREGPPLEKTVRRPRGKRVP